MAPLTHIHLLGICGTGMGALAELLVEEGFLVTGSDQNVYPPMSDELARLGVKLSSGYDPANLAKRPDAVIIGNVIRRDNPEAAAVLSQAIPYQSMPKALYEYFLKERTPLVIAGTHGKTTTATLTAWLLREAHLDPGFFIGGVGKNFEKNAAKGTGPYFVVEGDEYDTAFFDKGPKFLHYAPHAVILTSVEFDHADIYRDLAHVEEAFWKLIASLPPDGVLVANFDDPIVERLSADAPCRVVSYGHRGSYRFSNLVVGEEATQFELATPRGKLTCSIPLFGDHNISNAVASLALLLELGLSADDALRGLTTFKGVKRRQEIISTDKDVILIDDFAHHPTAVKKTIAAVRSRYPNRRLWALFEPRSNTSRRNIFQNEYVEALMGADRIVIAGVYNAAKLDPGERLDSQWIADALMNRGIDAHHISDPPFIVEYVIRNIDIGDVILIMSNGAFGGIHQQLLSKIDRRRLYADHSTLKMGRVPKNAR